MEVTVLIADDEPPARERLRELLEQESGIRLVAACADGLEAAQAIRDHRPDLAFLDIRMPGLNGFEVIQALLPGPIPSVVFVTAHDRYAIEAFNVCAVDYLLKPFDQARFQKALLLGRDRVQRQRAEPESRQLQELLTRLSSSAEPMERLVVRGAGKITLLNVSEIDWIQGAGNYAELHVGEAVHFLRQTLGRLEQRLPKQFVRISKSHFVNLERIREMCPKSHGDAWIVLRDGTRLVATRMFRDHLRRALAF
jgi:two-component system LytT family response regulator